MLHCSYVSCSHPSSGFRETGNNESQTFCFPCCQCTAWWDPLRTAVSLPWQDHPVSTDVLNWPPLLESLTVATPDNSKCNVSQLPNWVTAFRQLLICLCNRPFRIYSAIGKLPLNKTRNVQTANKWPCSPVLHPLINNSWYCYKRNVSCNCCKIRMTWRIRQASYHSQRSIVKLNGLPVLHTIKQPQCTTMQHQFKANRIKFVHLHGFSSLNELSNSGCRVVSISLVIRSVKICKHCKWKSHIQVMRHVFSNKLSWSRVLLTVDCIQHTL